MRRFLLGAACLACVTLLGVSTATAGDDEPVDMAATSVEAIEAIEELTCACEADDACVENAKSLLREWMDTFSETRGDEAQVTAIEEAVKAIGECNMDVMMVLLEDEDADDAAE